MNAIFTDAFFDEKWAAILSLVNKGTKLQTDMQRVDFSESCLTRYDLSYVDLSGANISYADWHRINLEGANLRGANLEWINLSGANLRNVDFTNAKLYGASVEYADLTGAILSKRQLNDISVINCAWGPDGIRFQEIDGTRCENDLPYP